MKLSDAIHWIDGALVAYKSILKPRFRTFVGYDNVSILLTLDTDDVFRHRHRNELLLL